MTDLERLYSALRLQGLGHYAAIRELARRIEVDEFTIKRALARAERKARPA